MQQILHKIGHETAKYSEIAAKTNKRPPSEIAAKIKKCPPSEIAAKMNSPLSNSKLINRGMCPIFCASMMLQLEIQIEVETKST